MQNVISGEFFGKSEEEAIEEGLKALNLTRDEVEIEVLEEAKRKLFGSTKAKVRLTKKPTDGERAQAFLEGLFSLLQLDATISGLSEGERIVITLETANSNALIGRRGEILDSLQCLAGAVANTGREEYKRVVVDCQDYREKREDTLKRLAEKVSSKAVAYGKKMRLEPMNPYERRIIHSTLAENPDVKTQSEGKEPNRYVVIIPNNLRPYRKNDGRKPYNKNNNGKKPYDKNRKYGDKKPYEKKPYDNNRPYDRNKKYDRDNRSKRNYTQNPNGGTGAGTGTGTGGNAYGKRDAYKKSSSSFFGTYLGNSRGTEEKPEKNATNNETNNE